MSDVVPYQPVEKLPNGQQPPADAPVGALFIISTKKVNGQYKVLGYVSSDYKQVLLLPGAPTDLQDAFPGFSMTHSSGDGSLYVSKDANLDGAQALALTANKQNASTTGAAPPVTAGTVTAVAGGGTPQFTPQGTLSTSGQQVNPSKIISDFAHDVNGASLAAGQANQQIINFGDQPKALDAQQMAQLEKYSGGSIGDLSGLYTPNYATSDTPGYKSVDQATDDLYAMSPGQVQDLQKKLTAAGYGKLSATGIPDVSTIQAYQGLLLNAYNYQQQKNDPSMTPDKMLAAQAQAASGPAASKEHNVHASTVTLTDPTAARGFATSAIASALGRNPTADEIAQFTASLQAAEQADPKVTNGTTTTDQSDGTTTNSNTTTSGGIADPSVYAQQWVEQNMPGQVHAASIGTNLFSIIAGAMHGGG